MVLMSASWTSEVRIGECAFCKYTHSLVNFWNTYLEIPTLEYVLFTIITGVAILFKIHCRRPNCPMYTQVTSDANLIKSKYTLLLGNLEHAWHLANFDYVWYLGVN